MVRLIMKKFSSLRIYALIAFSFLFLFPLSCNQKVGVIEGYKVDFYIRPSTFVPSDFSLQPSLVIMGDGYRETDFGVFERDAKNLVDHLFSVSPFSEALFPYYFNIFLIFLNSQERGIGFGSAKNTALRCYFYNDNEIFFDDVNFFGGRKAPNPFDVAQQYISNLNMSSSVVVVLVNDSHIGYTTSFKNIEPYDNWISIISVPDNSDDFKRLVLREVGGKAFAHLAQEDSYYGSQSQLMMNLMTTQLGYFSNIDFTDNPNQIKWGHFLKNKLTYPEIGIHHIGNGVYRPNNNNVMMSSGMLEYDAPSREAIIKRIYQIHHWDYTDATFRYYFLDNKL